MPVSRQYLARPRNSLKHWIHNLEMTRIRNQHDIDLSAPPPSGPGRHLPLPCRAEVILHVTGFAHRICGCVLSLELLEDRLVRFAQCVRENVDASAMRHRQVDFARAVRRRRLDCNVEHRDQDVAAFDREALIALIRAAEESLETIHYSQSLEQRLLLFVAQWRVQPPAFDLFAKPLSLFDFAEVRYLEPDSRGVELSQPGDHIPRGAA